MSMRPSSRLDLDNGNKSIACVFDVLSQQARKPLFVSCPQLRHQGTMFFDERMQVEVRTFINPDQMSDYGRLLEPQMEQATRTHRRRRSTIPDRLQRRRRPARQIVEITAPRSAERQSVYWMFGGYSQQTIDATESVAGNHSPHFAQAGLV